MCMATRDHHPPSPVRKPLTIDGKDVEIPEAAATFLIAGARTEKISLVTHTNAQMEIRDLLHH